MFFLIVVLICLKYYHYSDDVPNYCVTGCTPSFRKNPTIYDLRYQIKITYRYRTLYDLVRMEVLITPMALAHPLHPIKSRSGNKCRNLWVGWYVSSWRPWFWPAHSIYYIHTTHYSRILTNWNKLFLRDIHTKSWRGHAGVLHDLILSGFRCAFSLWSSILYVMIWI